SATPGGVNSEYTADHLVLRGRRRLAEGFVMFPIEHDCQACGGPQYLVLLAVSGAIVAHRDLPSLFEDFAGRPRQIARFGYIVVVVHDAASNTMRLRVAGAVEPTPTPEIILPPEEDPAGLVWQTQKPLILVNESDLARWPRLLERVRPFGV